MAQSLSQRCKKMLPSLCKGYLWLIYLSLIALLVYYFRVPLKAYEKLESLLSMGMYFNNLTPKFYVALTGTSSLVSGIILIFEWWYFKKKGGCRRGQLIGTRNTNDGMAMEKFCSYLP